MLDVFQLLTSAINITPPPLPSDYFQTILVKSNLENLNSSLEKSLALKYQVFFEFISVIA